MSEPIQAISQGNYILATQQEVSHDNSLSGNGTVNSPLSVVPGYNETVLWEADTSTTAALRDTTLRQGMSANLSEAKSHFDKIEVWANWNPNAGIGQTIITTYPASNSAGGYVIQAGASHPQYMARGCWSATDTNFKVVSASQSDSWPNFSWQTAYGGVVKIIGINRIANN